ncbi:MAG: SAM-dependent methyltransferase [Eubacteriales bacterium]
MVIRVEKIRQALVETINKKLYQVIISNPLPQNEITKVKIRPIMGKDGLEFQSSSFKGKQVFHKNYKTEEMIETIVGLMTTEFKQIEVETLDCQIIGLVSKKGKVTVKRKEKQLEKKIDLSHNRKKKYILEEGIPVPFLIDLGVQTKDGKIVKSRYDKFKQINRFLEFIDDIVDVLPKERLIQVIDFGCGKSYLTFAMYYFLKILKGLDVHIVGLDLKEEVIEQCAQLAKGYGYDQVEFLKGDISEYGGQDHVDLMVTLHACDTATDFALHKAVQWDAKVILSVPCCQHEVNKQIENELLEPVLKYGLIKERVAALLTDAIRGNLLEENGYQVQMLEFIDIEHTPKNILIRGMKTGGKRKTNVDNMTKELQVNTTLQQLLKTK